jgi:hypothetical protein
MAERMTKTKLKFKLDLVNDALGNSRESYTMTDEGLRANVGTITLDWAYGGVRVCRMVGPGGGETDLSMRGTMREAATYLDAMLTGINIERGCRK